VMSRFSILQLHSLRSMFDRDRLAFDRIHSMRSTFARLSDAELAAAASKTEDLIDWIALAATAAFRILGQDMYDVQLRGGSGTGARFDRRDADWGRQDAGSRARDLVVRARASWCPRDDC